MTLITACQTKSIKTVSCETLYKVAGIVRYGWPASPGIERNIQKSVSLLIKSDLYKQVGLGDENAN